MKRPMTVLSVAAPEDEPLRQRLERHLTLLEQRGLMQGWHGQQILAGSGEAESRETALQNALLVLLLISADFFPQTTVRVADVVSVRAAKMWRGESLSDSTESCILAGCTLCAFCYDTNESAVD